MEPPSRMEFTNVNGGRVDCTVRGNPLPTVDWLAADGGSITNILGIRHVLGNGTIHFPAFEAEAFRQDVHWAIYKCSAVNSVGAVVSRDVTVRAGMSTERNLPSSLSAVRFSALFSVASRHRRHPPRILRRSCRRRPLRMTRARVYPQTMDSCLQIRSTTSALRTVR